MKIKKNKLISSILAVMLLVFSFTSFIFAETPETVVDIAIGVEGEFTVLEAALVEADLVTTLQGEGPFTVFAPTNDAFVKLLGALGIEAEDLLGHPQLADVLLYHVVSGKVLSTDLSDGLEATTLQGEKLLVDLSDGVKINESTVVSADIEADNGVIHVIDTVLVPEAFVLAADDSAQEDVPKMGDIGVVSYVLLGALGATGLVAVKKRKHNK